MEISYRYTVAGHTFVIAMPEEYDGKECLSQYSPFSSACGDDVPLMTLRVAFTDNLRSVARGELKDIFNDEAPFLWLFEDEDKKGGVSRWSFAFSHRKNCPDCIMTASEDFSEAVVYIPRACADRFVGFALNNAIMLQFTFRTCRYETLMVHASVIVNKGRAYMFLGRSGTGKSTHSRLWLENIPGSELLNDDNPVVRIVDGKVLVYGSPWSGKTVCYRNESAPLGAVVRLSQAPQNRMRKLSTLQAFASLMPSCSCMRWDSASTEALHRTVEKVVMQTPGWSLECLPDADAALTCLRNVESKSE